MIRTIGDDTGPVGRSNTLPIIRISLVFVMDDAADIYRIDRLPVRLLLLQLARDRGLKISELRLCGDLCIRGAYIRKVCGLPALFKL